MKPITTLILLFSITCIQAQTNLATPNANFEQWTHVSSNGGYDDPNNWNCLNSITAPPPIGLVTCFKDSTTVRSGKYSMLLVTMTEFSQLIPGTATTGTINPLSQVINGGVSYTLRPDSIIGWYQYTPVSGDNGDVEFYVFGANHTDTIGQAFFKTPVTNVSVWTRISLPIIYSSPATPDTALWIITSSDNQVSGHAGSQLIVDSVGLVFNNSTGINTMTNTESISVGPNPTTGLLSINNIATSQSAFFTLFDLAGRKVYGGERITQGINYINLFGIPDGAYIYSIQDEKSIMIKTGKIIVQK